MGKIVSAHKTMAGGWGENIRREKKDDRDTEAGGERERRRLKCLNGKP